MSFADELRKNAVSKEEIRAQQREKQSKAIEESRRHFEKGVNVVHDGVLEIIKAEAMQASTHGKRFLKGRCHVNTVISNSRSFATRTNYTGEKVGLANGAKKRISDTLKNEGIKGIIKVQNKKTSPDVYIEYILFW